MALPTLSTLVRRPELHLHLIDTAQTAALRRSVEWVHSSDLTDPTPFLGEGTVLLTTGTWLGADDEDATADAYVARLVARGLVGLGFGTEVVRAGTPEALVTACAAHGLPLFEVPYRTPFIAVVRASADLIAADAYARHSWALDAQRAISLAALRPDGLQAALAELARQLGTGVALFDATGGLDRVFPADAIDSSALDEVRRDVLQLLSRAQRASRTAADGTMTLHTLGRRGRLRGVLAVGGAHALDRQSREVVASVVGLASLALEQNAEVESAIERLRGVVMQALIDDDRSLAERVAGTLWPLPSGRVRLAALTPSANGQEELEAALTALERTHRGALFHALTPEGAVILIDDATSTALEELSRSLRMRIGVSQAVTSVSVGLTQATRALAAADDVEVADFGAIASLGVLSSFSSTEIRARALAALEPLTAHDAAHGTELVDTLAGWLENDAQFDRAALALGVHRHTVRARVATAERLLDRDLSRFPVRAELWAALLAAR